jgi:hypothetical protein
MLWRKRKSRILQHSLANTSLIVNLLFLYRKDDLFSPCCLSPLMALEIIHSSIRTPELTHTSPVLASVIVLDEPTQPSPRLEYPLPTSGVCRPFVSFPHPIEDVNDTNTRQIGSMELFLQTDASSEVPRIVIDWHKSPRWSFV